MKNASLQETTPGPLEDLGWTALSIATALVLLPAIGAKALAEAVRPKRTTGREDGSM